MPVRPWLSVLLAVAAGCTQPVRVDEDVPGGTDAPTADVPASPDTPADVPTPMDSPTDTSSAPDVPLPLDTPLDAPILPDCDGLFGSGAGYMNCGVTPTTCSFIFMRATCDASCAAAGWRCVMAYDDLAEGTCMQAAPISCSLSRLSAICVCSPP
jgi:hypothetical protein